VSIIDVGPPAAAATTTAERQSPVELLAAELELLHRDRSYVDDLCAQSSEPATRAHLAAESDRLHQLIVDYSRSIAALTSDITPVSGV
jgi:hypothetical protein